jgi:hypothetical protein
MSDSQDSARDFLKRWSQRKRAAQTRVPDRVGSADAEHKDPEANTPLHSAAERETVLPAFDLATLPSIESITATSDIRAFLAPGVPEELTRAALRRVWLTDPTIRDFVGIAENQWDFTKPDSVPGFGSLQLTPEVRRMVANLIGDAPEDAPEEVPLSRQVPAERCEQSAEMPAKQPSPATPLAAGKAEAAMEGSKSASGHDMSSGSHSGEVEVILQYSNNDVAVQKEVAQDGESPRAAHRKHGGAVPR